MTPLNVLLVSDGRAGHFRLSEGIVAALERRRPVAVTRVEVRRPKRIPGRVLSFMSNNPSMTGAIRALFALPAKPLKKCDLVVSAGGATLAANVAYARTYGCKNIFYGSLRHYQPPDFSLVLTSYTANTVLPNHALSLKPSALDPDTLPPVPKVPEPPVTIGLLIGGDSGTVTYHRDDWNRLLFLLSNRPRQVNWIVSNSRRTPDDISDRVAAISAREGGRVRFIDVRTPGPMALLDAFAAASVVAVTCDSSSMVSEGVWTRRPVVVLTPAKWHLPPLEEHYRNYLARHGWTTPAISVHQTNPVEIVEAARALTPLQGNPLDQLADLFAKRLPGLFA